MQINFATAIDSIKQKSWWIWCLIILPFSYFNLMTNTNPKGINMFTFLAVVIATLLYPALLGFALKYAKNYSEKLIKRCETFSFKEFYIIGIKYALFFLVFSLTFGLALTILAVLCVGLLVFFTTSLSILFPIKMLSLLVTAVLFIIVILIYATYFLAATLEFIRTENIFSALTFKKTLSLIENNKKVFLKLLGWVAIVNVLNFICNILATFMGFISPMFLCISTSLIIYATTMLTANLYAQTLVHLETTKESKEIVI